MKVLLPSLLKVFQTGFIEKRRQAETKNWKEYVSLLSLKKLDGIAGEKDVWS